jgi:hypothetical protein
MGVPELVAPAVIAKGGRRSGGLAADGGEGAR